MSRRSVGVRAPYSLLLRRVAVAKGTTIADLTDRLLRRALGRALGEDAALAQGIEALVPEAQRAMRIEATTADDIESSHRGGRENA